MNVRKTFPAALAAFFALAPSARADLTTANTVDKLIQQFHASANSWQSVIMGEATWIFGALALISFVLTFGLIVARGTEWGEIVATLIRWVLFTGIAFWAMTNGPTFAKNIVDSFYQLGGQASSAGKDFAPTMFLDTAFTLYQKILQQEHWYDVGASVGAELIGIGVVLLCGWMTANLILAFMSSWVFASAGTVFLAFGGLVWTRDIAVNFYRTVLAVAAKVMVMILVMGIGYTFLQQTVAAMSASPSGMELVVLLAATFVLALLSHSLPNLVASVVGGPGGHSIGNLGMGVGLAAAAAAGHVALRGIGAAGKAMDGGMSALEKAVNAAEATIAGGKGGKKGP